MRHIPSQGDGLFCIHPHWKWEIDNDGAVLMHTDEQESSVILERPVEMSHAIMIPIAIIYRPCPKRLVSFIQNYYYASIYPLYE